ncbi:MAG: Signaling protein ykoW [Frankiales bacterium]|nr:Signaling protein ykoW [Frankiales bacterium]
MNAKPDRYRDLFAQSGVPQAVVALDGTIAAVNAATCALFDRSAEELIGEHLLDRVPTEGREHDAGLLAAVLDGRLERTQFERRLDHRDGRSLDTLVSVASVRDDSGALREISVCLQDITALRTAQRAAERAEARWRSLSQNASDIALIVDGELEISYVSPSLEALLGNGDERLLGTSLLDLVHPEDTARVSAAMHRVVIEGSRELLLEFRVRAEASTWRHVEQRVINLLGDPDVQGLVANLRDVTQQYELQTTLQRAAIQDALTGLPNRTLLMDRAQQAIEREQAGGPAYAMLFVNIDRLKAINDAYGRTTGDDVLRLVADTLCALVRPADTVARYAGDEFAVLLDDLADSDEAEATGRRVTAALNTALEYDGKPSVRFSACVGLAYGPAPNAEALISAAEAATSRAKALGRGRLQVLEKCARERDNDSRTLGRELAAAVAAEQLAVHYQPIIDLTTGRIVSFEALVRWPHPERGLLAPASFLPLADALDLQITIDEWVLHEACRTATTWEPGPTGPVAVAVNVAPSHLTSPGFADHVRSALHESGLQPSALVLEVTETAVVTDLAGAEAVLRTLCDLGVGIAIDDFGTGYSSMLQLRQLPFDKLKIDREFVRRLPQNRDDIAICASVISLASRLRVRSIAEGIETAEQAATLRALGCGFGQGFLWSQAVDAPAAHRLLEGEAWNTGSVFELATPPLPGLDDDPALTERARSLHESGASLHTIAARLNADGLRTPNGRRWHPATVARLLYRPKR